MENHTNRKLAKQITNAFRIKKKKLKKHKKHLKRSSIVLQIKNAHLLKNIARPGEEGVFEEARDEV